MNQHTVFHNLFGKKLIYQGNYLNWLQFPISKKNSFCGNYISKHGIPSKSLYLVTSIHASIRQKLGMILENLELSKHGNNTIISSKYIC